MPPGLHFVSNVPLRTSSCKSPVPHSLRCTLAPESPSGRVSVKHSEPKRSQSVFYRPLPADLPHNERLPPPPVHWSIPVVGFLIEQQLGLLPKGKLAKRYGDICTSNFFLTKMAYVSHYGAIVDILRDAEVFRSKGAFDAFTLLFGAGIIIALDPPHHTTARTLVAPAFSPSLFPFLFDRICARVNSTWERVQSELNHSGHIKLDPVFREHYLSIVVEMTTGIDMDSALASEIRSKYGKLQNAFLSPPCGPFWNAGQKAKRELMEILEGVVHTNLVEKAAIIEKLREYGDKLTYKSRTEMLKGEIDVLIIAMSRTDLRTGPGQKNDPEVIKNLCNLMLLFWFAGYATSAATSACAAFEMGWSPEILEQLTKEQDELVMAAGGDRTVTYQQMNTKMPLMESYITEVLRLYPPANGVTRKLSTDIEILGHRLEKGLPVFVDFSAAMRDERFFPDPYTLKVDRFMRKEGQPPANRILSFGGPGSPHYCLGGPLAKVMIKTTFATLIRNYTFKLDPAQRRDFSIIPEEIPKSKVVVNEFATKPKPN